MAENNDLNADFAENPQNRLSDGDLISRQAALNMKFSEGYNNDGVIFVPLRDVTEWIKNLPTVQPTITHEQAIDYLHETGWLQNHDRILTESKIVPSVQPEIIRCRDCEFWTKQPDSLQGRCALSWTYPTGAWYCANARKRGEADGQE